MAPRFYLHLGLTGHYITGETLLDGFVNWLAKPITLEKWRVEAVAPRCPRPKANFHLLFHPR